MLSRTRPALPKAPRRRQPDDVRYTAGQLGHEDPRFTLKTYTQAAKRREPMSGPHLKAYDQAIEWTQMGTSVVPDAVSVPVEATKNPA